MERAVFTRTAAVALVAASAFYSLFLCWLFTKGLPVSNTVVALADAAIVICAAALVTFKRLDALLIVLCGLAANFLLISIFSQKLDFKSVRDAVAIVVFLALGLTAGNASNAKRAFFIIAAGVAGFGLFEFFAPRFYVATFHILQFYIMRGVVDRSVGEWFDSSLFVSGLRGGSRNLLPILGSHRVSSIFMEPVSMGNFGAIAVAWALSLSRRSWLTAVFAAAIGASAIVMADARFAAIATLLFFAARLAPLAWTRFILALAPLIAIGLLIWCSTALSPIGDDLPSRLSVSGAAIVSLTPLELFGLSPGGPATLDSGYAYALTAFGLPLCLALWTAFVLLPTNGAPAARFKLLIGCYICALLCVSGSSLFALKTGALLWFLLGSMMAEERAAARVTSHVGHIQTNAAPQAQPA